MLPDESMTKTISALAVQTGTLLFCGFETETLRKHAHAIYRKYFGCKNEKFHWKKIDIFLIFAQNIDCGYTLEPLGEAVLTSIHNLYFGAKITKIGIPPHTPVFLYKSGV